MLYSLKWKKSAIRSLCDRYFLLFGRFDTLARSGLSSPSVRGTSFSGGEGITLLPAISCKFCTPHGSCIEQSRIEPRSSPPPAVSPPIGRSLRTPDPPRMMMKRPTRFVSRDLEYSLFLAFLASETTVPGVDLLAYHIGFLFFLVLWREVVHRRCRQYRGNRVQTKVFWANFEGSYLNEFGSN